MHGKVWRNQRVRHREGHMRHTGVRVMCDRLFARCLTSGSSATAKCHERRRLRAMLCDGLTEQLFGVFMKAVKVHGLSICVRRMFREWYEMQSSRVVMCQGVGGHQDVNAT